MSMGRISTYFNHPHMDPLISCAWDRRQGSLISWITTTRPWQPWQLACLPFDHLGYHRAHYADKSRPIVSIIVDFKNVLSCFLLVPFLFSRLFFHQTCRRFVSRWWEHSPQSASESEFAGRGRPIPVPIRWILILIVIMDINRLPTFTDHDNPCKCQYIYTHTYIIIYIYIRSLYTRSNIWSPNMTCTKDKRVPARWGKIWSFNSRSYMDPPTIPQTKTTTGTIRMRSCPHGQLVRSFCPPVMGYELVDKSRYGYICQRTQWNDIIMIYIINLIINQLAYLPGPTLYQNTK